MKVEFNSGTLHDAVLHFISVSWKDHTCDAGITLVGGKKVTLSWQGVTDISMPHSSPWGESQSINNTYSEGDVFKIEMQSGDIITIGAKNLEIK